MAVDWTPRSRVAGIACALVLAMVPAARGQQPLLPPLPNPSAPTSAPDPAACATNPPDEAPAPAPPGSAPPPVLGPGAALFDDGGPPAPPGEPSGAGRPPPGSIFDPGATGPGINAEGTENFLDGALDPDTGWPFVFLDHFAPGPIASSDSGSSAPGTARRSWAPTPGPAWWSATSTPAATSSRSTRR